MSKINVLSIQSLNGKSAKQCVSLASNRSIKIGTLAWEVCVICDYATNKDLCKDAISQNKFAESVIGVSKSTLSEMMRAYRFVLEKGGNFESLGCKFEYARLADAARNDNLKDASLESVLDMSESDIKSFGKSDNGNNSESDTKIDSESVSFIYDGKEYTIFVSDIVKKFGKSLANYEVTE